MNNYIEILNKIKANYSFEWLFPSQKIVYGQVIRFCPPNKIVNIYGNEGVGKTFIGWVLEKQGYGTYFSNIDSLTPNTKIAIIDNFDHTRKSIRSIRNELHFSNINYAILITHNKADDVIPCFQLSLSEDDIQFFKGNLYRLLDIKCKEENFFNLWKYFYPAIQ